MRRTRQSTGSEYAPELKEIQDHFLRAQEELLKGLVGLIDLFGRVLETKSEGQKYESLLRTIDSIEALLEAFIGVFELQTGERKPSGKRPRRPQKGKQTRKNARGGGKITRIDIS